MLRTAICDDDEKYLSDISKSFMEKCSEYSPEIRLFTSSRELLYEVENEGYIPDLLLLDIVLSEGSGIDLAKKINTLCPTCRIIYLTSYLSYVSDVYETRHSYFILKSQFDIRICAAVAKAVSELTSQKIISFRDHSSTVTFSAYEILYLERSLKKTIVFHSSGKQYSTYTKPDILLKDVGEGLFIQCHQSYYVNMQAVTSMQSDAFLLNNGFRVPISRSRLKEARDAFYAYVSKTVKSRRDDIS